LIGAYNNATDNGEQRFLNGNLSEIIFIDTKTLKEEIKINQYIKYKYSNLNLGADINTQSSFCSEIISVPTGFANLLWSTGQTVATINVNEAGAYWVRGTDAFGLCGTTLFK
jgi:hypothetical protein